MLQSARSTNLRQTYCSYYIMASECLLWCFVALIIDCFIPLCCIKIMMPSWINIHATILFDTWYVSCVHMLLPKLQYRKTDRDQKRRSGSMIFLAFCHLFWFAIDGASWNFLTGHIEGWLPLNKASMILNFTPKISCLANKGHRWHREDAGEMTTWSCLWINAI